MENEEPTTVLDAVRAILGAFALVFLWTPCLWLYEGWVIVHLWRWALVPMGVPAATLAQAIGINFVFAVLHGPNLYRVAKPYEKAGWLMFAQAVQPTMALALGWLAHRFLVG